MGVPGKTSGHSIQIVLGGSKKNRGLNPNETIANFNAGLKKAAADGKLDKNPKFKAAVEASTVANRAGSPIRQMNNNMMNQTDMGQMPFQNNAIMNAQGMKQIEVMNVDPNIPGVLPGSGNVPGNQQVPNPVAKLEDKPKSSIKAMEVTQVSKDRTEVQEEGNKDVKKRTARLGGSF